jgi:cardiolipin synthase A/B
METFFLVLAVSGIAMQLLMLVLALFEPPLEYRIVEPPPARPDSPDFARLLGVIADADPHSDTSVEVLKNGSSFYEAELAAIASAKSHVCVEAYIFQKSEIGRRFIRVLAERARAGVKVMVLLDAVGSFNTWPATFRELIAAGGQVRWYMPFRWYNLPRFNHRTHRELIIIDGAVGFIGGAGIADHWYKGHGRRPPWRDSMFRLEGKAVSSLQAMFSEDWLESSGELLAAPRYYPDGKSSGAVAAMIINSTPTHGRATRARMVFQTLIASATRSIHITTPYFLPDRSARAELIAAVGKRGVDLKIIVPGKHSDHLLTRRSSRRLYGELLKRGARIYEYKPSMIHAKALVVDGVWSVVGSTNFDSRSFGINEEVNLAALDETLAARIEQDFQADLAVSQRITYDEWRRRSPFERFSEWLGWLVERQE